MPPVETTRDGSGLIHALRPGVDDASLVAALPNPATAGLALSLLHGRYEAEVHRVCWNHLRTDRSAVDDAVQETFIRLFRGADQIRNPSQVLRWLRRVARRVCLDHLKSAYQRSETPTDVCPDGVGEADVSDRVAAADLMGQVLGDLPLKHARLLHAFYVEDRTIVQIAQAMGSTPASIKTQLCGARRSARVALLDRVRLLIPLPALCWWSRVTEVVKVAHPGLAMVVAAPVVAAAMILSTPPLVPAQQPVPSAANGAVASASLRPQAAASAVPTVPPLVRPSSASSRDDAADRSAVATGPAGDGGQVVEMPARVVTVPVVGQEVERYEAPQGSPDGRVAVSQEQTGEVVFIEVRDEPEVQPVVDAVCSTGSGINVMQCDE